MDAMWDLRMPMVREIVNKCILCMDWNPIHPLSSGWTCLSLTSLYMGMPGEVYPPNLGE